MYKAFNLSPMIPSFKVRETVKFFTDVLSFIIIRDEGTYVILAKDNTMVHIQPAGDIGEMSIYLAVEDIDALWADIEGKLKGIKVKPPFDREYGMREIHVIVPETKTLLFIGQVIDQQGLAG